MQLSGSNNQIHGSKSPPTPMVQTSVSANHSRNVSQSSGISNTDVAIGATPPQSTPSTIVGASAAL